MNDSPEYRVISAKTLAIYLLTLSGTPCIYEGGTYFPSRTVPVALKSQLPRCTFRVRSLADVATPVCHVCLPL